MQNSSSIGLLCNVQGFFPAGLLATLQMNYRDYWRHLELSSRHKKDLTPLSNDHKELNEGNLLELRSKFIAGLLKNLVQWCIRYCESCIKIRSIIYLIKLGDGIECRPKVDNSVKCEKFLERQKRTEWSPSIPSIIKIHYEDRKSKSVIEIIYHGLF